MLEPLEKLGTDPKPGLERIKKFMDAIDNPQNNYQTILITGTNGKGSTTAYLSQILKEEGYRVGSFYSPHIISPCERIQIDGKWISEKELLDYEEMIVKEAKKNPITYWEGLAALAYQYFNDKNIDYAVVEILMGGRYDATNVANPVISIITKIELDHTEMLGTTYEKIAWEKAGIIKGGSAITAAEYGLSIIKKEAEKTKAHLRSLGEDFFVECVSTNAKGNVFDYLGYDFYSRLQTSLLGHYQITNASLAVAAAEEIGVSEDAIRKGLEKTIHPGRLQVLSQKPLVIADGAHNPDGIGNLVTNLYMFKYENLAVIFAAKKTKDWQKMLELLCPYATIFIATEYGDESVPAEEISKEAKRYTHSVVEKDLKKAFSTAKNTGAVLICGSLYLLRAMQQKGIINLL
ncbi:MAG: folylpolyglutamate synthase/dihydrofolate synthase family protein [Candidatus Bilamarchaeaceae archaeon]